MHNQLACPGAQSYRVDMTTLSAAEVEEVLERMKGGASVQMGGSRCHSTYSFSQGQWRREDFDESATYESVISESEILKLIADEPSAFQNMLRVARWDRFVAAFVKGELDAARSLLPEARRYGDPNLAGETWAALLDWPATALDPKVVDRLRRKVTGMTAYHLFMEAMGWKETPETAARGLQYADTLLAIVGPVVGLHYLRSVFYRMAGDLTNAEAELTTEVNGLPEEDRMRSHFQEMLTKLRSKAPPSNVGG